MPQRYREKLGKEISDNVTDDSSFIKKMILSGITTVALASQLPNSIPVSVDFAIMGATFITTYHLPQICHWVKEKLVDKNKDEIKMFNKSLNKKVKNKVQGVEITQKLENKVENSMVVKQKREKIVKREIINLAPDEKVKTVQHSRGK